MKYTAEDIERIYQNSIKTKKKYTPDDIETIYQAYQASLKSKLPTVKDRAINNIHVNPTISLPTKEQAENNAEKDNRTLLNKTTQPLDSFKSNYTVGKLSEQESLAWSEYRKNQSQENLKI